MRRMRPAVWPGVTGKVGVCAVTSGPGATNLITGIATAFADSIPLVCITGQVNSELLGSDVFQEADITGAVESFVKYSYLVKNVEDIPQSFQRSILYCKYRQKRSGPDRRSDRCAECAGTQIQISGQQ